MKSKHTPDDFAVEELTDFQPTGGDYALYRLSKRGIGTLEAAQVIREACRLDWQQWAVGGLKDAQAVTTQFVTIHRGQPRNLRTDDLSLEYLGQANRAFASTDIRANRFVVVLRDASSSQTAGIEQAFASVGACGVPNYFDDQRFGSVGKSGQFVAKPWCLGDYESALRLALADSNIRDRPADRADKRLLERHWRDWNACLNELSSPERRRPIEFLRFNSRDFRGAIARLSVDARRMYLSAFQSYLWNQLLDEFLRARLPAEQIVTRELADWLADSKVAFFLDLDADQAAAFARTALSLPTARTQLEPGSEIESLTNRVVGRHGLAVRQLRVKYPRDSFFSKGDRPIVFRPTNTSLSTAPDELHPDHQKITLTFDLPRGCYATILMKRLLAAIH